MKQVAARLLMFLGLGAAASVAIAWACEMFAPLKFGGEWMVERECALFTDSHGLGRDSLTCHIPHSYPCDVPTMGSFEDIAVPFGSDRSRLRLCGSNVEWQVSGLPLRCLERWCPYRRGVKVAGGFSLEGGIRLVKRERDWYAPSDGSLPVRPVITGLLADSLLWGSTAWLLTFTVSRVRTVRRIRSGLCPACAYPVGTSPVCKECGKPVRPSTAVSP